MMKAIQFKLLQRKLKFRNPNHWIDVPTGATFEKADWYAAERYLEDLHKKNIHFTYPGDNHYPNAFLKMKEPPLFLEYRGKPHWVKSEFLSVVGSRELSGLTRSWVSEQLPIFLKQAPRVGIVSGGARGVDQLSHLVSAKAARPTVFILPSGLANMYPDNLSQFEIDEFKPYVCFLSEFESTQKIHKSHFYFRNRLIAALGDMTLVAQASLKSGSLLTVHHCLENGKPVAVVPSHPDLMGFDGNLKLIREGAQIVAKASELLDFWNAEFHYK